MDLILFSKATTNLWKIRFTKLSFEDFVLLAQDDVENVTVQLTHPRGNFHFIQKMRR